MIVSDRSLRKLLGEGTIVVQPLEDHQIQPASIDLRLGEHFLKVDENRMEAISLDRELEYIEFKQEQIIIPPHSFLLAVTRETIKLPENITAFVEGGATIVSNGCSPRSFAMSSSLRSTSCVWTSLSAR